MLNILLCEDAYDFVLSVIYSLMSKDEYSSALVIARSTITPQSISFHNTPRFQDKRILSRIGIRLYNNISDLISFLSDIHLVSVIPRYIFIPSIHESLPDQQSTNQLLSLILNISNISGVDRVYLNYYDLYISRRSYYENYIYFLRFTSFIYVLIHEEGTIEIFKCEWSSEDMNVSLIGIASNVNK
jgi:hypothetical protein